MNNFLAGLAAGAKKAIEHGSPSRLWAREIGLPIAQGIAMGIGQGSGLVNSALLPLLSVPGMSGRGSYSGQIMTPAQQSQQMAARITVSSPPIYLDGIQLARAFGPRLRQQIQSTVGIRMNP